MRWMFWKHDVARPSSEALAALKEAERAERVGHRKDIEASEVRETLHQHQRKNGWAQLFEDLYRG